MPKVFALHEVVLPAGMTPDEYAEVFGREVASSVSLPGWKTYLLKGDRGEGAGKLVLLFEVESVEARDRYFPRPEEESEEFRQFDEQHPDAPEWQKLTGFLSQPHSWTDYIVTGASSGR
jgi:hypothetical protein